MSNSEFMNTDDLLELLAEYGNPNINRTRNRDAASPSIKERDPDGVHWSLFIRVFGLCQDVRGTSVTLQAGSNVSAKDAALKVLKQLEDMTESGHLAVLRANYIAYYVEQMRMWRQGGSDGKYRHPDRYGPKSEPEWEAFKNDPCVRPTEEELQP